MADASRDQEDLYQRVAQIIETTRGRVARTVNTAMVHAYWLIGREIVEVEQQGKERAEYGEQVVRALASRLSKRYGRGFSYPSVKRMKQFYLTFPNGSAIPDEHGRGFSQTVIAVGRFRPGGKRLRSAEPFGTGLFTGIPLNAELDALQAADESSAFRGTCLLRDRGRW